MGPQRREPAWHRQRQRVYAGRECRGHSAWRNRGTDPDAPQHRQQRRNHQAGGVRADRHPQRGRRGAARVHQRRVRDFGHQRAGGRRGLPHLRVRRREPDRRGRREDFRRGGLPLHDRRKLGGVSDSHQRLVQDKHCRDKRQLCPDHRRNGHADRREPPRGRPDQRARVLRPVDKRRQLGRRQLARDHNPDSRRRVSPPCSG